MSDMINIKEEINDLDTGEYGDQLEDYSGYICYAIMEIADYNIEIYTSRLWDWARDNEGWCEEAIQEFGADVAAHGFTGVFQMGQYLCNSSDMYEHFDDNIKFVAYKHYLRNYGEEMDADKFDELNDELENIDHNDHVSDITDMVDAIFEEEEE